MPPRATSPSSRRARWRWSARRAASSAGPRPSAASSKPSMPDLLIPTLLAGGWRELPFTDSRPAIRIHRIYGDGAAAAAALLWYEPGASAPLHEHTGYEHILVLEGEQED